MARAKYLPCAVSKCGTKFVFEVTSPLLPLPGCQLIRFDGVYGTVAQCFGGSTIEVNWHTAKGTQAATYHSVTAGMVI